MIAAAKIRAGEISQTCKKFRGLILILHNVELNDLYSSPKIIRTIKLRRRWARHVEHMEKRRGTYRVLVGKPKGKRPLGRSKHRWEDNIKMDLQAVGWGNGLD